MFPRLQLTYSSIALEPGGHSILDIVRCSERCNKALSISGMLLGWLISVKFTSPLPEVSDLS